MPDVQVTGIYAKWTTMRLLHHWYWQPHWEDREGVRLELRARGIVATLQVPEAQTVRAEVENDQCS
jgi:hypothetical protein